VSIIVPVYNSEKFIAKCIESILAQTYDNFELLLINDGSTDNSLKICNEYSRLDKRIKVTTIENSGPSIARNVGLDIAKGELIQFVDSDDYLDNKMVELMVNAIGDKHELAICGYKSVFNNREVTVSPVPGFFGFYEFISNFGEFYKNLQFQYLWNKIYLARIIKKYELRFDETTKRGEDILFNLDYLNHCKSIFIIDNPLYYYNHYNLNSLTMSYNKNLFEDQQRIFKKVRLFLKNHDQYESNKTVIERLYINRVISCFDNLFASNNDLTKNDKIIEISRLINHEDVRKSLKYYKGRGIKWIILKLMIKYKVPKVIYFFYKLKYMIRKNWNL